MTVRPLHLLVGEEQFRRPGWAREVAELTTIGGTALRIHVRAPFASGRQLLRWTEEVRTSIDGSGAALSINDRVDVAAALGLDVHLGQRSLAPEEVRRLCPSATIGVSCHSAAEVAAATEADYLFVGPAFPTRSHPGAEGLGLEGISALASTAGLVPSVAIGGVSPDRTPSLIECGVIGVAVIRGIWDAPDSRSALASYISALGHE